MGKRVTPQGRKSAAGDLPLAPAYRVQLEAEGVTNLKTRRLGQDGPQIPLVGLGCMGMSDFYGPADDAQSTEVIRHALDLWGTILDPAGRYDTARMTPTRW